MIELACERVKPVLVISVLDSDAGGGQMLGVHDAVVPEDIPLRRRDVRVWQFAEVSYHQRRKVRIHEEWLNLLPERHVAMVNLVGDIRWSNQPSGDQIVVNVSGDVGDLRVSRCMLVLDVLIGTSMPIWTVSVPQPEVDHPIAWQETIVHGFLIRRRVKVKRLKAWHEQHLNRWSDRIIHVSKFEHDGSSKVSSSTRT